MRLLKIRSGNVLWLSGLVVILTAFLIFWLIPKYANASTCPVAGTHTYDVSIVEYATETTDGLRTFVCINCGDTFEQIIPATGHTWSSWTRIYEPTCVSEGYETRVCTKHPGSPHYEEHIIPMLSASGQHQFVLVSETLATCTEGGFQQYSCSICGTADTKEVQELGHSWGSWEVEVEPTAYKEGMETRVCEHESSHRESRSIPMSETPPTRAANPSENPDPNFEEESSDILFTLSMVPTIFDGVFLALDILVVLLLTIIALPLFYQSLWIKKKRVEMRKEIRASGSRQSGNS